MQQLLTDKVVLVAGGTSGVGAGIARAARDDGGRTLLTLVALLSLGTRLAEALKAAWTDRLVRVRDGHPDYARFAGKVGRVVTVNYGGRALVEGGLMDARPHVQFVMGVKNAMPADGRIFDFYIETLNRLSPDAQWCAAGIGPAQITINEWAIAKGGHTRTGMEDNVRLDRDRLAPSNAALVRRAAELCEKYDRPVATWRQARDILGLRMPQIA